MSQEIPKASLGVDTVPADGARLILSATLEQSDSLTLKAEYEGETRPNYQSHSGLLKATWGF
ncbi:hypothetical protein [Telmatospirillum siberiense]|uniref:Autotransporter domain-containing protein n=1 Tax=Telmatospirillum siberiense TaxID=382514 RepID=A0A2N3PXN1_9PROT|nr:hypothetical protein [Telmatospirillum siberiense]PKU25135.1 hypothetical protein CWS72_08020 [Telmatospirillum siberiense]